MSLAYPLQWPPGWERHKPQYSRFGNKTIHGSTKSLLHELGLLKAKEIIISTDLPLRKSDGLPKSNQRQPIDRGVAVYFKLKNKDQDKPAAMLAAGWLLKGE
jgi:hypothetical protein